jgi:hypothetical protein
MSARWTGSWRGLQVRQYRVIDVQASPLTPREAARDMSGRIGAIKVPAQLMREEEEDDYWSSDEDPWRADSASPEGDGSHR